MRSEVCPNDWQEVSLSTVADASFSSVDKKSHAGEQPVRLCNYIDVYKNEYVTGDLAFMRATATRSEIAQFGVRLGDVIITKDSETPDDIGIPALADYSAPDLVCGYHLAMLRPKSNRVASAFLAKQLRHSRLARYFGQQANGLTRYGLPKSAVQNAPLWIPREPKEGERIAEILRQLDVAIREAQTLVAKLRQVKAGLLHDLLTRGLDEHGQLRDPARHPEQFRDSTLGTIPKTWEVSKLGELCEMKTGGTPDRGNGRYWNGSIPWVKTAEINYAPIRQAEETITEQGLAHSAARLVPKGTILMAIYGEGVTRGRVAILAIDAAINQACLAFFPRGKLTTPFLFHYFVHGYDRLRRLSNEGSQKNLSSQILADLPVATPLKPEQEQIVDCLNGSDARLEVEESQLSKLYSLKRGLAHDLLTGRVRVRVGGSA